MKTLKDLNEISIGFETNAEKSVFTTISLAGRTTAKKLDKETGLYYYGTHKFYQDKKTG